MLHWRALTFIALSILVSGCITEHRGKSRPEADPEAALERRVSLARQYVGSGDWENAKRNLDIARELDGDSAIVHEAFGLVYQSTGENVEAERSFQRALRLEPTLSRARNNYAAFLYSQGRYEEAAKEFRIVTEDTLYRARPAAFINLGNSLLQLGDKSGAEAAFNRALSMDRSNPIALLNMANLRLDAGDVQGASQYYGVYKIVVPRQPPAGLLVGYRIATEAGDREAASNYEFTLRNLYPQSPEYRSLVSGSPR